MDPTPHPDYQKIIDQSVTFLKGEMGSLQPKIGLILGSGLGVLAEEIKSGLNIPYSSIPGFPISTVAGHKGELIIGSLEAKEVVMMNGRFHYYEGYTMQEITLPVRVLQGIGVEKLIITNAAGGVNENYTPGDLMLIKDHINFAFTNPLIGPNLDSFGPRFPDTSSAYDHELLDVARNEASKQGLILQEGVYLQVTGPSYETPAEIRMARHLGADAIGMSTVPEVLTAVHSGLSVLGISCITNMGAGIMDVSLDHSEVMDTVNLVKKPFSQLIKGIVHGI